VLEGEKGPRRDVVLMNAAAGLVVAGKADALAKGMLLAGESIDSGGAKRKLQQLVEASRS
jgi:anthranilate phosphoribosyltransferase